MAGIGASVFSQCYDRCDLANFLFPALKSCPTTYCIDQSNQHTSCGDFVSATEIPPGVPFLTIDDYALYGMDIATALYCRDVRIRVPSV